jgi:hypothetical protein
VGGTIEELGRAHDPRGVALGVGAGLLKVAGAAAPALARPWGRAVPRWLLPGAAWAASPVLTAYGGLLVAVGALVLTARSARPARLIGIPVSTSSRTADALLAAAAKDADEAHR